MHFKPEAACTQSAQWRRADQNGNARNKHGGNIRIAPKTPFMEDGRPAKNNAELIERAVWLSRKMAAGANPSEAER